MTSGVGENQNIKYILLCAYRDFVLLVSGGFRLFKLKIFTIIKEIGYYPINLNLNWEWRQATAMTRATRKKRVNRLTMKVHHMFEAKNAWHLELVWALGAGIAR